MSALDPDLTSLEQALSHWFAERTGEGVLLAMAREPLVLEVLTLGEQLQWQRVGASPRRQLSWRLGRAALKGLLPRLGCDTDTSGLSWPHPVISLTHSDDLALAVGVAAAGGPSPVASRTLPASAGTSSLTKREGHSECFVSGIGVDLEPMDRTVSAGIVRHFLTAEELARWQAWDLPEADQAREALRLWTVKEAVWKSCPENHRIPLNQVTLVDLAGEQGEASFPGLPQWKAHYYSVVWCGHWVSLAVTVDSLHDGYRIAALDANESAEALEWCNAFMSDIQENDETP